MRDFRPRWVISVSNFSLIQGSSSEILDLIAPSGYVRVRGGNDQPLNSVLQ